jgi:hypothetical protein
LIATIDATVFERMIRFAREQTCPACHGPGPIDFYTRHTATCLLICLSWKDRSKLCCRRCGFRHVLGGLVWTTVFGWWHIFGPIVAPWQMLNGFRQLASMRKPDTPSAEMVRSVALDLAAIRRSVEAGQ